MADVVFFLYYFYLRQMAYAVDIGINIVDKPADDAQTDGVVDVIQCRTFRLRQPLPVTFAAHTAVCFNAVQQMFINGRTGAFLFLVTIRPDIPDQCFHDLFQTRSVYAVYICFHMLTLLFVMIPFIVTD